MRYDSALIYHMPHTKLHGAVIDAFEYFFAIYEHNKDFKLILIDSTKEIAESVYKILENRYILDGIESYKDNVVFLRLIDLITTKFDKAFISSRHTAERVKGLVFANKLIVTSGTFDVDQKILFNHDLHNVVYYGEMPYDNQDIQYRIKILTKRFKPLENVRDGVYVNSPRNKNMDFLDEMSDIIIGKPVIVKAEKHMANLFEHFDTYIYYHANKWFDVHPRLFLECAFYDKDIYYFNKYDVKDGSYYRYHDLMENGMKDRHLNEHDEIVKEFI